MAIVNLTLDNFKEGISGEKPVVVDFNADWCGPCQMQAPILEEIAEDDNYVVASVNIDDEPELAEEYAVSSIPCLVFFKNGEEVKRSVGLRPKKDIVKTLEKING